MLIVFAVVHDLQADKLSADETPQDSPRSRIINRLTSIIPHRNVVAPSTQELQTNVLPGFGFADYNDSQQNNQLTGQNLNITGNDLNQPTRLNEYFNRQSQFGSLEFVPPSERKVPAIYIEGEGYLPLTHPSIEPYIDPLKNTPETNPNIVLVSERQLFAPNAYNTLARFAIPNHQPAEINSRTYDTSGKTVLSLPSRNYNETITISAKKGWQRNTEKYKILFLNEDCTIRQGNNFVQAPQAVVFIDDKSDTGQLCEIAVYLESESPLTPLVLEFDPETVNAQIIDKRWFGKFYTNTKVQTLIMNTEPTPEQDPVIYKKALKALNPESPPIEQVQYTQVTQAKKQDSTPFRRISLNPRGDNEMSIDVEPIPDNPDRAIFIISKGMNLIIEGVTGEDLLTGDVVDISADHAIIWSVNPKPKNHLQDGKTKQDSKSDFEVYLEGNIIFRDGERVIKAKRMYYDAKNKVAHVIDGELTTPIVGVRGFNGTMRIKSEVLRKIGEGNYNAKNSFVTTSLLGQPAWSLRSRSMSLTDKYYTPIFSDESEPLKRQIISAESNTLVIGRVPVFYWPWLAADAKEPTYYIKSISVGSSGYYGYTVRTEWNPFQLFNIQNRPDWLEGSLGISWMEKRGIGHGFKINYSPQELWGKQTNVQGQINYWGINDISTGDQLGGGRNPVVFPHSYRYIFSWSQQQTMNSLFGMRGDWSVNASVSKVSDRNVFPYYNNAAWVNGENNTTSVEVTKTKDDSLWKLRVERSLDDFYTNANQLPRLDHYLIGRSFLYDKLTFYSHSRVGYIDYNVAKNPYAPDSAAWYRDARYFRYLPWELNAGSSTNAPPNPSVVGAPKPDVLNDSFEIFSTRAEVDLPFSVGAIRVVPYVLGDFSHWGADRSGDDVQRLYYRSGVRFNLPFWKVMPNSSSRTLYVNGLAHKMSLDAEFSYAQSNESMENLILTDSLDRWAIEDFRRRYSVTSFGGAIPLIFDPRYYAYRSGIAGNVTSGNMEIADDLTLMRVGMSHRWQTKRGQVGRRHIIDWITFSTHLNYYPDESQNFGKNVGLVDYDFMWHVGDRFSVFSSGLYDVFDGGQQITRIGGVWNRPNRGNITVMYDQLDGSAVKRDYLTLQVGYTMNEKYSASYSTSYDITANPWRNVGHNFIFTRTGESFRLMVGAVYSESLDEWSFTFGIEPVFMQGIANKLQRMSTVAQQQATQ
ncbi:MAG: hypothetical protein LBL39_00055 [Planctomycetaceae bacterium]|nr:hypothetical protein [Planctomycetaceae bacterium]